MDAAITLPPIDVLLPAYNGAAFIREQIQSIIDQDYAGQLRIHVRDDGSSDDTVATVQQIMAQSLKPLRQLYLTQRTDGVGGVSLNISALIHNVQDSANYIALADQDDVWLPYKLRIQMQAMLQAEAKSSPPNRARPLLICSDLTVVDAQLQPLHHSFWALQKLNPKWVQRWQDLLVQNMVTGCTTLFNKAAIAVIMPIPLTNGIFHDHWIGTAVAYYGRVIALPEQTLLYRQHGDNVVGAHAFDAHHQQRKLKQLKQITQRSQQIAAQLGQSRSASFIMWNKFRLNVARFFL